MENIWILLAVIAALCGGTSDAFTKKALQLHDEYTIAWLRQLVVVLFLSPCLFFIPIPALDGDFYKACLFALPFEVIAYILYLKAIKISPLSLTVPFLSLTPVCLIIIPYVMLGESVSFWGGIGILMIALGSYTLNLKEISKGFLEPIKAIGKEIGSVFMIIVAIIYSLTNTFGKQAINHSSALFFGVTYNLAFFILVSPVIFMIGKIYVRGRICKESLKICVLPGFFSAVTVVFYTIAMSLANVAYTVAVCRLSLLVGVMYGHFLFKETGFRERLAGTTLMLIGFLIIALE
ncbi:MAG TPA: DMT family transporter [Syntrophales bacterium]|nr:DMT family transporter [Syntrophales bacterium]